MNNRDFDRALGRLMGRASPSSPSERRAAECASHQFADSIGGNSANYRAPYFGSTPSPIRPTTPKK